MAVGTLSLFYPVILPLSTAGLLYGVHRLMYVDWAAWATDFFTGPGSISRILLVVYMGLSWKNFPFMWHVSILPFSWLMAGIWVWLGLGPVGRKGERGLRGEGLKRRRKGWKDEG